MKQKVVVIGHGYTSRLAITRSVGMAGYTVDVVVIYFGKKKDRARPLDCYSKYVDNILYSPSGDENALVNILIENYKNSQQKPILIPDSDFAVKAIDTHLSSLNDYFLIPSIKGEEGAVAAWMNKEKQKELARSIGINVANCTRLSISGGQYLIPSGINYPCFPKPVDGGKKGLGRCENKEMLEKALRIMSVAKDVNVLVEDYLQIDKEYALVGFSDGNNVFIPAILYNKQMAHGAHYGVAKAGVVLSTEEFEPLIDKFKRLIREIGFVGLFDIDFFDCQGVYYFSEVNLRFGGSGYAVTKAGVNLPGMMADYFSGQPCRYPAQLAVPQSFANERTCLDDCLSDYTSFNEYKDTINHASINFIKDEDDAAPYKTYKRYVVKCRAKYFIKRLLNRQNKKIVF